MAKLEHLNPQRVFHYFEEIGAIPHGSENMNAISAYCMDFANARGLKAIRDKANNVIIYKDAAPGYEQAEPILLQGHLDMVCQKEEDCAIDFRKDGLDLYVDGDFIKARGTTLGADNGIAVAMVLAILESKELAHPALEAVFTTDEEIGMIGAGQLDFGLLNARKMINLDAEEDDSVTVSCAGGSDFQVTMPIRRVQKTGTKVTVTLKGLQGGHSGVEIHKGRVNANLLAGRLLSGLDAEVISINGGDKANAIPNSCRIELCTAEYDTFKKRAEDSFAAIQNEIAAREPKAEMTVVADAAGTYEVFAADLKEALLDALLCAPNGVVEMSAEIEGLVETSLNLGILSTGKEEVLLHFALRSNKHSAICHLEKRLQRFFRKAPCTVRTFGYYPSWEFKRDSALQGLYKEIYTQEMGGAPKVEAIHAGLECGVFAAGLPGLDCIAIGPQLYDVHTVNERLSISSLERMFRILTELLKASR